MKTKDQLDANKEEIDALNEKLAELTDEELAQVAGGNDGMDTVSLRFSGKVVPLPEAKSKKEKDGGYAGKIVPDSSDEQIIK